MVLMSRVTLLPRILSLALVSHVLAAPPAAPQGSAGCVQAPGCSAVYDEVSGFYCAAPGAGCAQCGATSRSGYTICTWDANGFHVCIDYRS